jgi:hypothetical protein
MAVDALRKIILNLVQNHPQQMLWAHGLPAKLIDEEARELLVSSDGDPRDLVLECNAFAISDRLEEITSLFDLVSRVRADALAKEAALYGQVLAEDLAMSQEANQQKITEIEFAANWKLSTAVGTFPKDTVKDLVAAARVSRNQAQLLRSIPGHPLNTLEQILDLRDRYKKELRILLGRAEAVRLVLNHSFAIAVPSLLKQVLELSDMKPNPGTTIADWLRYTTRLIDIKMMRAISVTRYRLFTDWADSAGTNNIAKDLQEGKNLTYTLDLDRQHLGVATDQVARIVGIGFAPVFGFNKIYKVAQNLDATQEAARLNDMQSKRKQMSFDIWAEFDETVLTDVEAPGKEYHFPKIQMVFEGIAGWGDDSGSASDVISLKSVPQLTNRPFGGKVKVTIPNALIWNGGQYVRSALINDFLEESMAIRNIAIGIQYVVHSKT